MNLPISFRFLVCLMIVFFFANIANARTVNGERLSEAEYTLPPFKDSGFRQTDDIKNYYETEIKQNLENAQKDTLIEAFEYSSDGLRVRGLSWVKRNLKSNEKLPILIWNRGGNRDFGSLDVNDAIWLSKFAQKGYFVFASQYRGTEHEVGKDEFGGKDVHDVLNLIKLAKLTSHADGTQIFVAGHSRGGMETYLVLKADPEIKAAASLAGECDLKAGLASRPDFEKDVYEELIPHYLENKTRALDARSACSWPSKIHAPLYILQGTEDMAVDPKEATELAQSLASANVPYQLEFFDGGHNLWFFDQNADAIVSKIDQWFQLHR